MEKNAVHEFVKEHFEDFLQAMSEHAFVDLDVEVIDEFDSLFSGNSFKEIFDMVVENGIDVHGDWYLCLVDGEWYGYPSSEKRIEDYYSKAIAEQLLDKNRESWDEVALTHHIGDDEICLKKIREEVLRPKKFRVNLIAMLEGIDVEADDYAEAYEKAISMLSEIARDVPIKNIIRHISGAEMHDSDGNFKGGITNCMDKIK